MMKAGALLGLPGVTAGAIAMAAIALVPVRAAAADVLSSLVASRTFKCVFSAGVVGEWDGARIKRYLTQSVTMAYHFEDVDPVEGTARMIGDEGARIVELSQTSAGLTFRDRTPSGNLSFTTVFARHIAGGTNYSAVHSRHVLLMSDPLPSQYYGMCRSLD